MQQPLSPTHTWTQLAAYGLVAIFAAGVGYLTTWLNRKKPAAEVHESITRSDLNKAQADSLRVRSQLDAGEMLSRIFEQLFEAQDRAHELIEELESAKRQLARIPAMEIELQLLNGQVERARRQGFLAEIKGEGGNPAASP
jgi:hypothetical protein